MLVLNVGERKRWDEIVKSFGLHDVYYFSSYAKAFQLHGDGDPVLFYFEEGGTRAINIAMKRDLANIKYFADKVPPETQYDLITPYGYGGFLVEGGKTKPLEQKYTNFCLENGIISEFVRFHPMLENARDALSIYETVELGKTVYIDLRDKNNIWSNFTGKNRNVIRKAKNLGVEIFWGRSPQLFEKFKELYDQTMAGQNADDYYYFTKPFYTSIMWDLRNHAMIFYATHKSDIIAMAIILFCNRQMHYHLSGSNWDYRNYAANNLLLYKAALWGHDNGFETFHLGGGLGGAEDSLYQFKKAFNRNGHSVFSVGKACFNREAYDMLVDIRKQDNNFDADSGFFPLYRA